MKFCLKCVTPLVKVFRLVNGDVKPTMSYIYEVMDRTEEQTANNFNGTKRRYRQTSGIYNFINLYIQRPTNSLLNMDFN